MLTLTQPPEAAPELTKEAVWLQQSAVEILRTDLPRKRELRSALHAYRALLLMAGCSEAEPGPQRDGKFFEASLRSIASLSGQSLALTRTRLDDFARLGLLDPFRALPDDSARLSLRLRLLAGDEPVTIRLCAVEEGRNQ